MISFMIKINTMQLHSYMQHFSTCSTHNICKMKTRSICKIMITTIVILICEIVNIISNLTENTPAK